MGIKGRFFNCLEFIYRNSKAKVKLLTKLSASIKILCGTEQGHSMSPELFKCYINDLSYPACRIIWMSSVASRNLVCQIHDRTNATQFLAKHSQRSARSAPPHIPQWTLGVNRKTSNAAVWETVENTHSPWNSQSKYYVTISACRN